MKQSWTIRILLIVLIAFVAVPAGTTNPVNAQILKSHPSIAINKNSDFTTANGVTSGDGTSSNPYIIEGWAVSGPCYQHPCSSSGISVGQTTAYFVIRHVSVSAGGMGTGVFYQVSHGEVSDSEIAGGEDGLSIYSCEHIIISSNIIDAKSSIYKSSDIMFSHNKIPGSQFLWADHSVNLKITNNNVDGPYEGLFLFYSKSVLVRQNNFTKIYSAAIASDSSSDLTIAENNVSLNGFGQFPRGSWDQSGIGLTNTTNSRIYHNNLIANRMQGYDQGGVGNVWDNGYPSGGNYFSDYNGKDNCTGLNQNICGSPDGIGDTPYTFGSSKDRYPLMHPYTTAIKVPVKLQNNVIKLGHTGKYLKVFVQLPPGVKVENIVASSIRLNNTLVLAPGTIPTFEKVKGVTTLVLSFTGVNSLVSRPGRYTIEVTGNILRATTFTQFFGFTSIHFVHSSHSRDDRNDQREFAFTDNCNYGSISSFQLDYSLVLLARNNSINSHSSS